MIYASLLKILQVVLCLFIVLLIMIQSKGVGLSREIGSSIGFYGSRRGLEKFIFFLTIFFGILFVANSLLLTVLN